MQYLNRSEAKHNAPMYDCVSAHSPWAADFTVGGGRYGVSSPGRFSKQGTSWSTLKEKREAARAKGRGSQGAAHRARAAPRLGEQPASPGSCWQGQRTGSLPSATAQAVGVVEMNAWHFGKQTELRQGSKVGLLIGGEGALSSDPLQAQAGIGSRQDGVAAATVQDWRLHPWRGWAPGPQGRAPHPTSPSLPQTP